MCVSACACVGECVSMCVWEWECVCMRVYGCGSVSESKSACACV